LRLLKCGFGEEWRKTEHKANEEVLELIGENRSLIGTIKTYKRSGFDIRLEDNHY